MNLYEEVQSRIGPDEIIITEEAFSRTPWLYRSVIDDVFLVSCNLYEGLRIIGARQLLVRPEEYNVLKSLLLVRVRTSRDSESGFLLTSAEYNRNPDMYYILEVYMQLTEGDRLLEYEKVHIDDYRKDPDAYDPIGVCYQVRYSYESRK